MPQRTYKSEAIVVKKTKLGESDVIVTFLDSDGAIHKAVAKGARKPSSSFSSRLELFSHADVLCAECKGLDIVKEARLHDGSYIVKREMAQTTCAAPLAELACILGQEGLEQRRLFDMTQAAFKYIFESDADKALAICAASLLKAMAIAGFRPTFDNCIACGSPIKFDDLKQVRFSFIEGGSMCENCTRTSDSILIQADILAWCNALLYSTFEEVARFKIDRNTLFNVLHLARQWIRIHTQSNIKSLGFLIECALFEDL